MRLNGLTLPSSIISAVRGVKKLTVYQYLWSSVNAVEESGLGPTTIIVRGVCTDSAIRDSLEQACQATGVKKLYFPSAQGEIDDRYFNVYTHPAQLTPLTPSIYNYEIECIAADPTIYDAGTDAPIWALD